MRFYYFNSTHWDREWYLPFERFRIKLIELVLHLLDRLENDPEYGIFTFDGQTVWMEDVEEIRPDLRARLEKPPPFGHYLYSGVSILYIYILQSR